MDVLQPAVTDEADRGTGIAGVADLRIEVRIDGRVGRRHERAAAAGKDVDQGDRADGDDGRQPRASDVMDDGDRPWERSGASHLGRDLEWAVGVFVPTASTGPARAPSAARLILLRFTADGCA